jgi:hypothetical protein
MARSSTGRFLKEWEKLAKDDDREELMSTVTSAMGHLLHQALRRRLVSVKEVSILAASNQNSNPSRTFQSALLFTTWLVTSGDDLLQAAVDSGTRLRCILDLSVFAAWLQQSIPLCSHRNDWAAAPQRMLFAQLLATHVRTFHDLEVLLAWSSDSTKQRFKATLRRLIGDALSLASQQTEKVALKEGRRAAVGYNLRSSHCNNSSRRTGPAGPCYSCHYTHFCHTATEHLPCVCAPDGKKHQTCQ